VRSPERLICTHQDVKKLLRLVPSTLALRHLDRRLATDHLLRRSIVASGTALSAVCYIIVVSAAR